MISKAEAHYTPEASNPSEICAKCQHFNPPGSCDLVSGAIKPAGWCDRFRAIVKKARNVVSGTK
jgi:hypothetical protein